MKNLFALLIPFIFFATGCSRPVDLNHVRQIKVSGQCQRDSRPDKVQIDLVASVTNTDLKAATAEATQQITALIDAIKKLQLAGLEIQTIAHEVQRDYEWLNNRQTLKGFIARQGIQVASTEVTRFNEVLDLATEHGLQEVGRLRPIVSLSLQKKVRESCLTEAVQNARVKANILAGSAGAKVSRVLRIEEMSGQSSTRPMPHGQMHEQAMHDETVSAKAPTVEFANETFVIEIMALFELE